MNDNKKEENPEPPFKRLQAANRKKKQRQFQELVELKLVHEGNLKKAHPAAVNIRARLSKQISTCDRKINAILKGEDPDAIIIKTDRKVDAYLDQIPEMKSKSVIGGI